MKKDFYNQNKELILSIIKKEVYLSNDSLMHLFKEIKDRSLVSTNLSYNKFFLKLLDEGLTQYSIKIRNIEKVRYTLEKNFNIYQFSKTLEKKSFFSMSTALNIQNLTNARNDLVFVSKERATRLEFDLKTIKQESIDNAFSKKPRRTTAHDKIKDYSIVILQSNNTNEYEVIDYNGYRVSSVNRVFVEAISNIQYFKNPDFLIKTFKEIKEELNVKDIYDVITNFDFIYPYYQLAGFYLEKIGFKKDELVSFYNKKSNLNFYTHKNQMKYNYNEYWKIYF